VIQFNNKKMNKNNKAKSQPKSQRRFIAKIPSSTIVPAENASLAHFSGTQPINGSIGSEAEKFFDVVFSNTIFTTTTFQLLTGIPQGVLVNSRVADSVLLLWLWLSYTVTTQNADIFSELRLTIFQWWANTALSLPTAAVVYQYPGNVNSPLNWSNSPLYRILYDKKFTMSGIATAPCDSGSQGALGVMIPLSSAKPCIKFVPAAVTGEYHIYIALTSNSVLAPGPIFDFISRLGFLNG
jgi:hypothetical protein